MKSIAKLISSVGLIIATSGVVDVRTVAALGGLGFLTWGVASKWDSATASIVLGVLLLGAVIWLPVFQFLLLWVAGKRN